ncbi:MAG: flagellar biosynthesis protein [Roseibium sp.]|uniref:flagellar biosynthesis protein n=1 Tax=Roseibium sp. TaxID=1936156 RepID=UPI001B00193F|nr:flagellar biosynthesis protein [Roseibium sp.]MBO6507052.1 flagellar biosynthesis protein [Roseibium sp.]MBO6894642.1 flagellar biosynthesis protein [Roseibium sp.]MBO6928655.1 flagellar biosynthesis protein [Roseibium sp.]
MPKVGNYVQRDYHSKFRSQRKSRWSNYNKAWSQKRSSAIEKSQQLRNIASTFTSISTNAAQANTQFLMQNRGAQGIYATPTAVMSRVNVLV